MKDEGSVCEHGDPFRVAKQIALAAVFSGAVLSVASVGIEDEDGTVFAGDLDRLAGVGALVEQVGTWLRVVGENQLAAALDDQLAGQRPHAQDLGEDATASRSTLQDQNLRHTVSRRAPADGYR